MRHASLVFENDENTSLRSSELQLGRNKDRNSLRVYTYARGKICTLSKASPHA